MTNPTSDNDKLDNTGPAPQHVDFIREAVMADNAAGRFGGKVHTRFPPEPNAYLHIGHAKAIMVSYGIARDFGGLFNLRFDDTNPAREEQEYVDAILEDVRWVGADYGDRVFYGSDYFPQQYAWAEEMIRKAKAYVCDLRGEQVSEYRGTLTHPGKDSPFRNRSVEENLDLFRRMRSGEFPDGSRTLRAKIDMASPNLNMRDPVMYRILHVEHHRQGGKWCLYPMYDWAHGLQDSLEGITHSLCSLEYENHRPLYDWFIDAINDARTDDGAGSWGKKIHHPRQIEFARLNMTYTAMSKRLLLELVKGGLVKGFDDPRMPTLAGLRRRGYTPAAIQDFCRRIGIDKTDSVVDIALLEHCLREDLNRIAPRAMAVLRPVKLIIDNYPEGQSEDMDAVNNPENPAAGTRKVPFSKVLYIEAEDVYEVPPPKFYRLFPGNEVRLRYAYLVRCTGVVKDAAGAIAEVHCTYDPATRGGDAPDGRKIKATLHWVSAAHAAPAEVRLYDHLFTKPNPMDVPEGADWKTNVNPKSLEVLPGAQVEGMLANQPAGTILQFERQGYFCVDKDSAPGKPVFNRAVSLKDAWAKEQKKAAK
jgi:glutaminyl-tRNA synthetase